MLNQDSVPALWIPSPVLFPPFQGPSFGQDRHIPTLGKAKQCVSSQGKEETANHVITRKQGTVFIVFLFWFPMYF